MTKKLNLFQSADLIAEFRKDHPKQPGSHCLLVFSNWLRTKGYLVEGK